METATTCSKAIQIWGVSSISPGGGKAGRHLCQNHPHQILITFTNAFCFHSWQPYFSLSFSVHLPVLIASPFFLHVLCTKFRFIVQNSGLFVWFWSLLLNVSSWIRIVYFCSHYQIISGNIFFCWYEMNQNYKNFSKAAPRISVCIFYQFLQACPYLGKEWESPFLFWLKDLLRLSYGSIFKFPSNCLTV